VPSPGIVAFINERAFQQRAMKPGPVTHEANNLQHKLPLKWHRHVCSARRYITLARNWTASCGVECHRSDDGFESSFLPFSRQRSSVYLAPLSLKAPMIPKATTRYAASCTYRTAISNGTRPIKVLYEIIPYLLDNWKPRDCSEAKE
jgi:hypothetical protein